MNEDFYPGKIPLSLAVRGVTLNSFAARDSVVNVAYEDFRGHKLKSPKISAIFRLYRVWQAPRR